MCLAVKGRQSDRSRDFRGVGDTCRHQKIDPMLTFSAIPIVSPRRRLSRSHSGVGSTSWRSRKGVPDSGGFRFIRFF